MQDRFKFRAFLKDKAKRNASKPFILNKIFDVLSIGFDSYGLPETVTLIGYHKNGDYSIYEVDAKDVVLMQCTGLKDKNGKLIYEGDILDLYTSIKKLYRYQVKYEIGSFMIVSDEEIFDFKNKWNDNVYPLSQLYFEYNNQDNCIWHCEVIGNIYETPLPSPPRAENDKGEGEQLKEINMPELLEGRNGN